MRTNNSIEHFVTLFDSNFLPMGMCLHASLMQHAQPFHLWILCMDELVEQQLNLLSLPHISLIPLREVETRDLLGIKESRTRAEYCWTLTPFSPQFVFDRDLDVSQVTYLDADLYFFDSPRKLLQELEDSGKQVLITEHAYAPEYDQSATSGKFCVQFMTFKRANGGIRVLTWWQARCLEWCFNRIEDGKFGDQKYLDDWPERFPDEVHIASQNEKMLAPWNVRYFEEKNRSLAPIFYHFHSFRIISPTKARLYFGYLIGPLGTSLYMQYLDSLNCSIKKMRDCNLPIPVIPLPKESWSILRKIKRKLNGIGESIVTLNGSCFQRQMFNGTSETLRSSFNE